MNALEQMKLMLTSPPAELKDAVSQPMMVYSVGGEKLASCAAKNWNPSECEHIWCIHNTSYVLMAVGTRGVDSDEWVWHTIDPKIMDHRSSCCLRLMHEAMDELGITYYPDTDRKDLIQIRTVGVVGWMMGVKPW